MILVLRTDSKDTYVGLYDQGEKATDKTWESGRELSTQLHQEIKNLCDELDISLKTLKGIVVYKGPGSYTGLRIGMSVANALAYSLSIPVIATNGEDWLREGLEQMRSVSLRDYVTPMYGGHINITQPKK